MKVRHLNCATLRPPFVRTAYKPGKMVCHCLLVEHNDQLVLVDSGLGVKDVQMPRKRLGFTRHLIGTKKQEETAFEQIRALGYQPTDVRHIILTHLDVDHAGGIADFPHAEVHVFGAEFIAAMAPSTVIERFRYHKIQWSHSPKWALHQEKEGEEWFGFDSVKPLEKLSGDFAMIPLSGHSLGHCGVAVKSSDGWLLHAGDAYFNRSEIHGKPPSCPDSLDLFQRIIQFDNESRIANQERLRDLANNQPEVKIFSAHDPVEFETFEASNPTA